jgi:hypothetical protein
MPDSSAQPVKFLLTYDIRPEIQDQYFQFVLGEMVPTLQSMGLVMGGAWHTAYGDYPMRLVEFVAEDRQTLEHILGSSTWEQLEVRLQAYVQNYSRKVVPLRENAFQF